MVKMRKDEYRCEMCRQVFKKGRSDEEALAEMEKNYDDAVLPEETGFVCDECYHKHFKDGHPR